jgi:putative spermidine/putrescine transport system ATP-binding protein
MLMSLELEHIGFTIEGKQILDDINFRVEDREFMSLLGASGAGKSTTIKIIAGILNQDTGHVIIDGIAVDNLPTHKRKASIVFQDMRLFPHLRVGENVAYPLKVKGVKKTERLKAADELLEMVQLSGYRSRKVSQLSGGQQQRVALARSVAGCPSILLLDEPFSGLDEELRDDMRLMVRSVHERLGMTTVMITHDATEALMMSDRIVYMKDGQILQDDTPVVLYRNPRSAPVATCFGNCVSLEGSVLGGVFALDAFSCKTDCGDGAAAAVLRNEGVKLTRKNGRIPVVQCTFRGDNYQITLMLGVTRITVDSAVPIEAGTLVDMQVDPQHCFVFPGKATPK